MFITMLGVVLGKMSPRANRNHAVLGVGKKHVTCKVTGRSHDSNILNLVNRKWKMSLEVKRYLVFVVSNLVYPTLFLLNFVSK